MVGVQLQPFLQLFDWIYTNRVAYNIRVVNMSLGSAAIASYKNDPLCMAVRRWLMRAW